MGFTLFDIVTEVLAGLLDWPEDWRPAREKRRRGLSVDASDSTRAGPSLPGLSRARSAGETVRAALTRGSTRNRKRSL